MANSTTNLPTITSSQPGKEVTANQIDDYESPASFFARNASSTGTTWNWLLANYLQDGVPTQLANGVLNSLPLNIASDGLYIQAARASATTKAITAITKAANAQLTITAHGYAVHQMLYIDAAVGGMIEIRNTFCRVVSVVDANNITVNVPSTGFTTYTSGGTTAPAGGATGSVQVAKGYEWHPGSRWLYRVTTGASAITSWTDWRHCQIFNNGRLAKALTDANTRLTAEEQENNTLEFTGTLTAQRDIILGDFWNGKMMFNNTTGGFGLNFKTANGTGIVVAATKRAIIYADGTNVQRVTADT